MYSTTVGYAGGLTPNPTYEEVCTGLTGHNEVVQVVFLTDRISYRRLLDTFWEAHDPTQGMRQGNDAGTQYRSGIYFASDEQRRAAEDSLARYQQDLAAAGYGVITLRSFPPRRFTMPKTTTSNTSPRIQTATADWAEPGCLVLHKKDAPKGVRTIARGRNKIQVAKTRILPWNQMRPSYLTKPSISAATRPGIGMRSRLGSAGPA